MVAFLAARILGEGLTIHSLPALFFFFFFKVDISSCKLILLFTTGSAHSGSASWDDCGWVFPTSCMWAELVSLIGSPLCPGSTVSLLWLPGFELATFWSWVQCSTKNKRIYNFWNVKVIWLTFYILKTKLPKQSRADLNVGAKHWF